jgi:hypothetical protein
MSLARQIELMEITRQVPAPSRPAPCGLLPALVPRPLSRSHFWCHRSTPPGPRRGQPATTDPRRTGGVASSWFCFNCDEKYSHGHNRFCRRIFFVDGVEIDDAEDAAARADKEAPCFSLQALAGVPMADTMQIAVTLGATPLVALLDSGSTHNFIFEEAVRRFGLPLR